MDYEIQALRMFQGIMPQSCDFDAAYKRRQELIIS